MHPFTNIETLISSTIRHKGKYQNGCYKKRKHVKFSEKRTFLTPWYANVRVRIRGRKCSFFGKFSVLWFLVTPVLRVALLSYYQWFAVLRLRWLLHIFHLSECNYQLLDEIYPPNMRTLLLCNERQLPDNCIYP